VILNSLRGVDIDSNAIEIAKLRFWLSLIVDADKPEPLPNLDFTLLQGNSLLGIGSAFKSENFLSNINSQENAQISLSLTSDTNVHEPLENLLVSFYSSYGSQKKELLSKIQTLENEAIEKLKLEYSELLKSSKLRNRNLRKADSAQIEEIESNLERLNTKNGEKNYFLWHWYFGDVAKDGGFDIVIGNPPYVSALEFTRTRPVSERDEIKHIYQSATGAWDLYVPFFELGINLLKTDGVLSFITPNKYLAASYAIDLRALISSKVSLKQIVDVSQLEVFKSAAVYPVITILRKELDDKEPVLCRLPKNINKNRYTPYDFYKIEIDKSNLNILPDKIWGFLLSDKLDILLKLLAKTQPMISCADVNATTTASEADEYGAKIMDFKPGMFKVINTGTIDPYISKWGSSNLTHQGTKWLRPGLSSESVSSKRSNLYKTPKILFAKMAATAEAFLDENGEYAGLNINCIYKPKGDLSLTFLLGYSNSLLFMFFYNQFFGALRMGKGYQFQAPQLRTIPVPKFTDKKFRSEIEGLVNKIKSSSGKAYEESVLELDLKFAEYFECDLSEIIVN
jgi:tRNA1(Val) A37 N6-methylase TrmN6